MCGIYGTTLKFSSDVVSHKLHLMNFRGPNNMSFQRYPISDDRELTLGHVRLSILDLDHRANQPFKYNEDIVITYNGEIYNFQELRKKYIPELNLRTTSDTEIICAMYEKYGTNCLDYFNGMFSFVIYDKSRNLLFGARDRLGKKPFYYYHSGEKFEFASQLSPLSYTHKFSINPLARQFFLFKGYIPDPYCIYSEVKKLRAGHFFTFDLSLNRLTISKYWDIFSNSCKFKVPRSYNEAKEEISELIEDAVRIRLQSDVPVGTFLSGGVDSSLVTAFTRKQNKDIRAYNIGFKDQSYDESSYAKEVADYLQIPLVTEYCEGVEMLRIFDNIVQYYDEPFADYSLIPTSLLAQRAKKNITVALGGDGGDELFWGYSRYFLMKDRVSLTKLQRVFRKLFPKHDNLLYRNVKKNTYEILRKSYINMGNYGDFCGVEKYCPAELATKLPDLEKLEFSRGLLSFSDFDMKQYMNSCINTKTDRASMRSSLELRSPIMDYRLAEYSRLLPLEYVYNRNMGGKRILKEILYQMVPRTIMERPKRGFTAPVGQWFRGELRDLFTDVVSHGNIEKYVPDLKAEGIIQLRDTFLQGKADYSSSLFKLFIYITWITKK